MKFRDTPDYSVGWLYDLVVGEEDARVCKDIPDSACHDQPRNFFAYLIANLLNKISDELISARLTLPWLFSLLGVPVSFVGFLVPIREAGVLLPQLLVAAYVRAMKQRKIVWLIGAILSAFSLFLMALIVWQTHGELAGWLLLSCLVIYSLARGLCSVSAKDVIGKTVSKTRRGRLMGYSAALAGLATLAIGLLMQADLVGEHGHNVLLCFIIFAGLLWLLACISFNLIHEPDGATEGGGNALSVALKSLRLVIDDKPFQQYVISRVLLMGTALIVPFYVILIQKNLEGSLSTLGWLIVLNGLASSLSAPLIGKFADNNSRNVMSFSALLAGLIGVAICFFNEFLFNHDLAMVILMMAFFLVTLSHGAIRLGRKVYLVDMANSDNRAQYVAVSNTIIGIAMMIGGLIGVFSEMYSTLGAIALLSVLSIFAGSYCLRLMNVSG